MTINTLPRIKNKLALGYDIWNLRTVISTKTNPSVASIKIRYSSETDVTISPETFKSIECFDNDLSAFAGELSTLMNKPVHLEIVNEFPSILIDPNSNFIPLNINNAEKFNQFVIEDQTSEFYKGFKPYPKFSYQISMRPNQWGQEMLIGFKTFYVFYSATRIIDPTNLYQYILKFKDQDTPCETTIDAIYNELHEVLKPYQLAIAGSFPLSKNVYIYSIRSSHSCLIRELFKIF